MTESPELVLFGNLLVDDIVLADGTTLLGEPGGAVLHAALAASLWGCHVGIVSVVGCDYPPAALERLEQRGVDLAGVRRLPRPGGRAWLLHEPSARRVIHHLDSPSHADISPVVADLPPAWRDPGAVHLAPMPLDRQAELAAGIAAVAPRSILSLDPFELICDATVGRWTEPLAHVDTLFAGLDDLRLTEDPAGVLASVAGGQLRLLVLKQADRGGRVVDLHGGADVAWPARAESIIDVTGAGDAFAGGFLAGRLRGGDLAASVALGVVSASFAISDWGGRGLARTTAAAAWNRLADWYPEHAPGERKRQGVS